MHKKNAYLFFFNVYMACLLATCLVGIQGSSPSSSIQGNTPSSDPITLEVFQKYLEEKRFVIKDNKDDNDDSSKDPYDYMQQGTVRALRMLNYFDFALLALMVRIYAPNSLKDLQNQIEETRNKAFTTEKGKETYNAQIYLANQLTKEEWNMFFENFRTPTIYKENITAIQDALGYTYSTGDQNEMTNEEKKHLVIITPMIGFYIMMITQINTFITAKTLSTSKPYDIDNKSTQDAYTDAPKTGDVFNYKKMDVDGEMKNMFKAFSDTADLIQGHERHDGNWSTMVIVTIVIAIMVAIGIASWYYLNVYKKKQEGVAQQAGKRKNHE